MEDTKNSIYHSVEKIENIFTYRLGITQRNNLKRNETGEQYYFIQPKDIIDGVLRLPDEFYATPETMKKHILKTGDLLLVNKGVNYATYVYRDEYPNCVASASFFVIKPNTAICRTEYLQWYLGQEETKKYFRNNSATTTVHSLNRKVLGALDIVVPPMNVQQQVVNIMDKIYRQNNIIQSLIEKNTEYLNSYIWESISSYEKRLQK